jgi:hypothetical protein
MVMLNRYSGLYVATMAFAALIIGVGPSPAIDESQPHAKAVRYVATPQQIRELGLFSEGMISGAKHFRNKCFFGEYEVSMSDAFLHHYVKRGFTPATTCLGLSAGYVHYDPQTGKPLKVVNGFLIEIPECFKNGTPYLDCDFIYEERSGDKNDQQSRAFARQKGLQIAAAVKQLLASGQYNRECGCSDLESYTFDETNMIRIKTGAGCYLDTIPACARSLVKDRDPAGWKLMEITSSMEVFPKLFAKLIVVNETFNISPRLPRGYAHSIIAPEGEDDSEFLHIDSGDKIGIGD